MNKQAYERIVGMVMGTEQVLSKRAEDLFNQNSITSESLPESGKPRLGMIKNSTNSIIRAIVEHLKENQKHYIMGAAGASAGGLIGGLAYKGDIRGILGGSAIGAGVSVGGGMLHDYVQNYKLRKAYNHLSPMKLLGL